MIFRNPAVAWLLLAIGSPSLLIRASAAEVEPIGIPLKPDPPPAVDGDLREWAAVPNAIRIDRPEQVIYGKGKWSGPDDLSATVWFAWRREYLFLAVDVADEKLRQTQRGTGLWKGDHIELYLDAAPDVQPQRTPFGRRQFHFGFSPGNFQETGDAMFDLKPEAVVFRPADTPADGVLVAAGKTAKGWAIEAAIPWTLVGVKPQVGVALGVEVGVSDTDGDEAAQETMSTIGTARWAISRDRLMPAALAKADGKAPPVVRGYAVFGALDLLKPGQKKELTITAPPTPPGRVAVLSLKARLDAPKVSGYCPALRLWLNGKPLGGDRLMDKPRTMTMADGRTVSAAAGEQFYLPYAPDFDATDRHPSYRLRGLKASQFAWRVTGVLRQGENKLVIQNTASKGVTNPMAVGQGRIEFRRPVVTKPPAGPPTGPLPDLSAATAHKVEFAVKQKGPSDLIITFAGRTFRVESEFSTPEPKWQKGSNRYFKHQRQIQQVDEALLVRDTFRNLTDRNLPIMHRHHAAVPIKKLWLAGLSPASKSGAASAPENPTSFAATDQIGLGLMAVDDVFLVHVTNYSDGRSIGLADNNLVLKPQTTYTAEWAILPTPRPDYYAFVNAARRLRGVNFPIPGSFAFLRADPRLTGKWSDQQLKDFAAYKDAHFLSWGLSYLRYKGHYAHGTAFQLVDHAYDVTHLTRMRKLVPDAKYLIYFHCYIDVTDEGPTKFADSRTLRSDGTQANYGQDFYRIYFPTESNSYGRAIGKNVDLIFDKIKADGVYWDEMEYSAYQYHYGKPWDGVSADIDPRTMKIARLKSSVTLITQPWRIALAEKIMARGPLVANGQPHTRTMARLHFPRFVETGSISHCARAQLFTPIALGDHLTERSELDAYRQMLRALDYGCVYYWYNDVTVIPTHRQLTRYMFPITPMELHRGYIIGKERIITNRSGLFGWGDASQFEAHVFDRLGKETDETKVPRVVKDGKTYAEVRIPEGYAVALVRVPRPG